MDVKVDFYFYPGISARYHNDQSQSTLTVVVYLEKGLGGERFPK